jgi:hypothetical protein
MCYQTNMKNLYLIDYENAHWCGGQLYVVVSAPSAEHAECLAADWMEETQRELFVDEYGDEEECQDFAEEVAYIVNSVELLNEEHEHWQWYKDPSQSSFYPVINE